MRHGIRAAIGAFVVVFGCAEAAQAQEPPIVWKDDFSKVLDARVTTFTCQACDTNSFASTLREQTGVAVCIDEDESEYRFPKGQRSPTVNIDVADVTAREILELFVTQRPVYVWLPTRTNIVNIVPVHEATDSNSRMNHIVSFSTHGPVPLDAAIGAVLNLSSQTRSPLTGIVGGGLRVRDWKVPEVNVAFDGVPFIDVMNGVFAAAGAGYAYGTRSKFITYGFRFQDSIQLSSHAAAQEALDLEDAGQKYRIAIEEAPYGSLKVRIGAEYANMLIQCGGDDLEVGLDMLNAMLSELPELAVFPNTAQAAVEAYVEGLESSGRRAEGTALLLTLIESGRLAHSLGEVVLERALIGNQLESTDARSSLERLLALRDVFPNRTGFHESLEEQIGLIQREVAAETP